MKKFFLTVLCMFISINFLIAHPPSKIELSYDKASSMLTVEVIHTLSASKVADPVKHFIKTITVLVNEKEIIIENIAFQQSDKGEKSSFLLSTKQGDKIEVRAICNLAGSLSSSIVIK